MSFFLPYVKETFMTQKLYTILYLVFFCLGSFVFTVQKSFAEPTTILLSPKVNIQINTNPSTLPTQRFINYDATFVPRHPNVSAYLKKMQDQWQTMQDKYSPALFDDATIALTPKRAHAWKFFRKNLQKASQADILRGVNGFMNKVPSKDDIVLYKQDEYWAMPNELFKNWGGDCEDYAFAKYFALKYFGWPEESLWVLLVYDLVHKGLHAVLAVQFQDTVYILDNLAKTAHVLIDESQYTEKALPLFALSKQGLWVFQKAFPRYRILEAEKKNAPEQKGPTPRVPALKNP